NPAYLTAALASVFYGSADFCGGLGARRAPLATVTLFAWVAGLALLLLGAPFAGGGTRITDLGWGVLGGRFGPFGAGLLYRALAIGPVSVASPIFCIVGLALPVLVGLVLGERPHAAALVGLALTPVSILLLTREDSRDAPHVRGAARRVLGPSLLAGSV